MKSLCFADTLYLTTLPQNNGESIAFAIEVYKSAFAIEVYKS